MLRSALVWLGFAQPEGALTQAGGHAHGHDHGHGGKHGHTHGVVDPTIATTNRGIWAIKWSFVILAITAALQLAVVFATGSVALLADTIHNVGDAVTAVPLWIAFQLVRRPPTQRFTYGLGRVEDLAGVAIVAIILFSAIVAGYEAISRLIHPQALTLLWAVAAAGLIGFIGNEAVAVFRIRVGREKAIMIRSGTSPWPPDSNQIASGELGAVQCATWRQSLCRAAEPASAGRGGSHAAFVGRGAGEFLPPFR